MSVCSICQRVDRTIIDEALLSGASARDVASRFGLSKSAVARHRTGHLAPTVAAAARLVAPASEINAAVTRAKAIAAGTAIPTPGEALSLASLLDRLARSLERVECAATSAAADSAYLPLASLSGQLHRGVETAARLQGFGPPAPDNRAPFSVSIVLPEGFVPKHLSDQARQVIDVTPLVVSDSPESAELGHEANDTEADAFGVPGFDFDED